MKKSSFSVFYPYTRILAKNLANFTVLLHFDISHYISAGLYFYQTMLK